MSRTALTLLLVAVALGEATAGKRRPKSNHHKRGKHPELSDYGLLDYDIKHTKPPAEKEHFECKDTFCDPPIIGKNVSNIKHQKMSSSRDVKKLIMLLNTDVDALNHEDKMRLKSEIDKITIDFFNYKKEAIVAVLKALMRARPRHNLRDLVDALAELTSKLQLDIPKHLETIKRSVKVLRPPCGYIKFEDQGGHRSTRLNHVSRPWYRHKVARTTKRFALNSKRKGSSKKFVNFRGSPLATERYNLPFGSFSN